jgi:hypothetical protein
VSVSSGLFYEVVFICRKSDDHCSTVFADILMVFPRTASSSLQIYPYLHPYLYTCHHTRRAFCIVASLLCIIRFTNNRYRVATTVAVDLEHSN